jgi:hypothetical protein
VTDEMIGEFYHMQHFQGGAIHWSTATGARVSIISRLELVIYRVHCVLETQGFIDWGDDEISLGATTTDSKANTVKVQPFKVGDFNTGYPPKIYTPPYVLTSFELSRGTFFPQNYFVTFIMAETDEGGVADFLNQVYEKTKGEIVKELTKLVVDYGIKIIGGNIFAALDKLADLIGLPSVGALVTELVGWVVDSIVGWIISWFADELFAPNTVRMDVTSVHDPLIIADSGRQLATLHFYGDGGHYEMDYGWRFNG